MLFIDIKEDNSLKALFVLSIMLVILEAEKGYLFLSTLFYFTVIYEFLVPYLKQNIVCEACLNFIFVVLAYVGYYLFLLLLSQMFVFTPPSIDWHMLYYILIEFLIVGLL